MAFLGDDGSTWNKLPTFARWGFEVTTLDDFRAEATLRGADAAMFDRAARVLPTLPRPFLAELVTISTHLPFDTARISTPDWLASAPGLDDAERRYLATVNYFDRTLGAFIDSLRHEGLWDDTLLFLMSDHSLPRALPGGGAGVTMASLPMTFIAANTGVTARINHTVGQLDIYPTILLLSGHYAPGAYNGLGIPMTASRTNSAELDERSDEARRISELIIRGDYFAPSTASADKSR